MGNKGIIIKSFIKTRWLHSFKTREQIEKYQQKELAKQIKFVQKHSKFYRDLDYQDFPRMTKAIMMANFDEINTVGLKKEEALSLAIRSEHSRDFSETSKGISVGLSSGTSGHQGLFVTDEQEQGVWAGSILAKMLPKNQLLNQKIAFFMRANNNLYETVQSKVLELVFFDMLTPMVESVDVLNDYQPTILIAPASVLLRLAKFVETNTLNIQPIKVISVAEILEIRDADYLKQVFKQKVIHQIYQCTEGFLGCTCEYGVLHLNEDIVKIEKEYIDETRFYPIITDLKRTSQPMFNYMLNDILVENMEVCRCGSAFTRIKNIEGRADDVFKFLNQNNEEVEVYPDFIRRCLLFVPGVRDYQVVQRNSLELEIYLDQVTVDVTTKITLEFAKLSEELKFQNPHLSFRVVSNETKGKLKRIRREQTNER